MSVPIDSLVEGKAGVTERQIRGRVYANRPTQVAVITDEGKQAIIYDPTIVGPPRPLNQRTDIPSRLR